MSIRLIPGDCRDVLATLPADSVHTVVTSPPYFGLRDYQTGTWDGGDAACEHTGIRRNHGDEKQASSAGTSRDPVSRSCLRCGAVRIDRQIGLEPTPEAYLQTMVEVFREVRRVLRPDGTVWCNIGDSYAGGGGYWPGAPSNVAGSLSSYAGQDRTTRATANTGLAAKQLLLMPARLALALQADGWWVRSDIIWHKPNPMPESVTDRPTNAHEHVFLLTRSARYHYDADAVREEPTGRTDPIRSFGSPPDRQDNGRSFDLDGTRGRNLRNVWTLATAPYAEAHFATFPPALAERCIRAGTSERGCCAQCGKPWVRVTETTPEYAAVKSQLRERLGPNFHMKRAGTDAVKGVGTGTNPQTLPPKSITTGWQPGCSHDADIVPCTILDPFIGAGTTALVADRLQRDCIGIDLNTAYTQMAMDRVRADAPLFADLAPVPEPPEDERMRDLFAEAAE